MDIRKIASSVASKSVQETRDVLELGRAAIAVDGDVNFIDCGVIVQSNSMEGDLACPVGEAIAHLSQWLNAKYAIDIAYRNFADRVKGPWRDAISEHWQDHSKDERDHAYDLSMKIIGLGGDPIQSTIQIPPCPASLEAFFRTLMSMELSAIEAARKTIDLAGDSDGLRILSENILLDDSHHLDDLRRWMSQVL